MPYIGGSFGERSTGLRLAAGFNAMGRSRSIVDGYNKPSSDGALSSLNVLALPLTLLNHVEFLFELDRTASLGTNARYGFVLGFGM